MWPALHKFVNLKVVLRATLMFSAQKPLLEEHEDDCTDLEIIDVKPRLIEQFYSRLCAITIATLAKNANFFSINQRPLNVLISLVRHYVRFLGRTIRRIAQFQSRDTINDTDVIVGFDELGINLQELFLFRARLVNDDVHFPYNIPHYSRYDVTPLSNIQQLPFNPFISPITDINASFISSHRTAILPHLPVFPNIRTYQLTQEEIQEPSPAPEQESDEDNVWSDSAYDD
ncbi:hypothetical protein BLNAU_11946 [Blattamonas nauphoetae]|uniref:Bromodomain associated domain-containing protein n=1 Tax=Blattamonas nauphoetae TaxID=2049346 RepID=A0ABQ9XPN6_9EUKA|nr:hypothetical protein BLNAU_11946 [Blattamonas nauphoetae]